MKSLTTTAALLLTTTAASAGGLEPAATTFGPLFEDGNYVELSFGQIQPSVSGGVQVGPPLGEIDSGTISPDYTTFGTAAKFDVDDRVSVALIIDQPYGADVSYPTGDTAPLGAPGGIDYPISGSNAAIDATGFTVLGKYQFNDTYSVYFGPRAVRMDGYLEFANATGTYDAIYEEDTAFGYVVGAAYERPDIALRVALTYTSELSFSHRTTLDVGAPSRVEVEDTDYVLPETITLDFQSGVAENTLVFGSIRYVDWTKTEINSFAFPGNPVVSYDDAVTTYTLGVGRQFTEAFAGSVSVSYEEEKDGIASNLAPTDGSTSISLGGAYDFGNGVELSGGVRYVMIGDAETNISVLNPQFEDNDAVAFGLKVAYTF